ncbi:thiamine pyrophosphate-dependent enzyme [Nocardia sp. NPDC050710]|uniref:thiamine pyrophosphate-dependent enzyme n=1 Tax=Nocardia sp. NPDC050710 TaxID=3157220 RepID=UPI0033DEB2A8
MSGADVELDERFRAEISALTAPPSRSADQPIAPGITSAVLLELFDAQATSRHLDLAARRLGSARRGYYSIGSSGHEGNAAVAAALRTTDPALLHYRSGAFFVHRARRVPGIDPIRDVLLGVVAAAADPISGGRHKVFGSKPANVIPQTSTIASHLPRAVGLAFALERAARLGISSEWPADSVVLCSFGDASANHSTAAGAINTAIHTAHQGIPMPILFLCEDNGIGISVPTPPDWIEHAYGHRPGLAYFSADGCDPVDALTTATAAADWVRKHRKPAFLRLRTVRLLGHAGSDVESAYRRTADIAADLDRDPVLATGRLFVTSGSATPQQVLERYDDIAHRVAVMAELVWHEPKLGTAAAVVTPLAPDHPDLVRADVLRHNGITAEPGGGVEVSEPASEPPQADPGQRGMTTDTTHPGTAAVDEQAAGPTGTPRGAARSERGTRLDRAARILRSAQRLRGARLERGAQPEHHTEPELGTQPDRSMPPDHRTQPEHDAQRDRDTRPARSIQPELDTRPDRSTPPEHRTQPELGTQPGLAARVDRVSQQGDPMTMAQAINRTLADLLGRDPDVLVFGEDVGRKGGVYGVTKGLQKTFGARRVFDTLLDEQSILGTALGAGLAGFVPIPEIQYLAYIHNAADQLRGEGATLSFFSHGRYRNPMVVRVAGLAYQKGFGGHFHNDNSLAALRDIPGLIIATPARADDAAAMLRTCVSAARVDGRVCVFVEPIALYHTRDLRPGDGAWLAPISATDHLEVGRAGIYGEGADLTIVSFANGVPMSLRVAHRLSERGIHARVLDLRWLNPLPVDDLLRHARATGHVLIADETRRTGGISEAVATALLDAGFDGRIARVTSEDSFIPLGPAADTVLLDEARIETAADKLLAG